MQRVTPMFGSGVKYTIPQDKREEFLEDFGDSAEESLTFILPDGSSYTIPASQQEAFLAEHPDAKLASVYQMDDGSNITLDDSKVEMFANVRKAGQPISRGMLRAVGIPEQYGRSLAERETLADWFVDQMPEEEPVYTPGEYEENLGDKIKGGVDRIAQRAQTVADEALFMPGSASRQWMDEGAERGELAPTIVKNLQGYSGKVASGVANLLPAATDVLAQALGGEETAAGRYFRGSAQAGRETIAEGVQTELPQLETGSGVGNEILNKANEFTADTGTTLVKFAIPGAAAVDISANAANTYYETYQRALANGADEDKAKALAAAEAGIGAVEGIILAQSAQGKGGFSGFIKRVAEVGAKMGSAAGARDIVEQGVEGAESPDLGRAGEAALKGAAEGAVFEVASGVVHGIQNKAFHGEPQTAKGKVAEEVAKETARKVAREQYEARMSDEARFSLNEEVAEQVKLGVIRPEEAEAVKARVVEIAGENARALDSAEVREDALLRAMDEVTRPRIEAEAKEAEAARAREAEKVKPEEVADKAPDAAGEARPVEEVVKAEEKPVEVEKVPDGKGKMVAKDDGVSIIVPTAEPKEVESTATTAEKSAEPTKRVADGKGGMREHRLWGYRGKDENGNVIERAKSTDIVMEIQSISDEIDGIKTNTAGVEWYSKSRQEKEDAIRGLESSRAKLLKKLKSSLKGESTEDISGELSHIGSGTENDAAKQISSVLKSELERRNGGKLHDSEKAKRVSDGKGRMKKDGKIKVGQTVEDNGAKITKEEFGDYTVSYKGEEFYISRGRDGARIIKDIDGEEIGRIDKDAKFNNEAEEIGYLTERARSLADRDWDAVEQHGRMIAQKKTRKYEEDIKNLKYASDKDKAPFRKLAKDYEDSLAEIMHDSEVRSMKDIEEVIAKKDYEEGSIFDDFVKAREALERFHEQAVRYDQLPRDKKDGRPLMEIKDGKQVDMYTLEPELRKEKKVLEWAKKKGRTISDGMVTPDARREYDREQAMAAAKLTKRWFPDMKVNYYDHGITERGKHAIDMRDKSGNSIGKFFPDTKEVALLPGADIETVAHEIMWHGTRQWATEQAAKGNERAKELLKRMKKVEQDVPKKIKDRVTRLYRKEGVTDADVLFNEWGAFDSMVNGGRALEEALATREGQKWYAKAITATKDLIKDYLSAHGRNRVDLSRIDDLNSEGLKEFLAQEFAGGKTLGEMNENKGTNKPLSTEETAWQWVRRKAYDSVSAIRDAEREYEKKTGKKISEEDSVDAAIALAPGLMEAVSINQKRQISDTKDMFKKFGLSEEDLGYYMALKAAAGRDAKVDAKRLAKIEEGVEAEVRAEWGSKRIAEDKEGFEAEVEQRKKLARAKYKTNNASHIDPREAKKILAELEGGEKGIEYGAGKDKIDEIQKDTLDTLVEAGLYSREAADKLIAEEPDYVPFKSEFDAETGEFMGHTIKNFSKKTFYEAKGRKTAAGDIIAHIINDNAIAHQKAIENTMREKLARFVEKNPELGTVEPLGAEKVTEARYKKGGDTNAIVFKRDGETMVIRLNGTRGAAMAAAITKANQVKLPQVAQKVARAWSMTATELSPTFAIRNFTKDNIELANIVYSEMGPIIGTEYIGRYVKNQVVSSKELMKYITTGNVDTSTETGKLLQRFIDAGGMIGSYKNEGYGDIAKALSAEQITKELKKGNSAARAAAKHTLNSLSYLNHMSEMTSRFNAFRTKVEMGESDRGAALWSRRALTDFNRKGDYTGFTNVVRMFSNSTLGASARAVTALTKSKYGAITAAAIMANGAANAIIEYYTNKDEDEKNKKLGKGTMRDVSEYDRKTSMWLYRDAETGKIKKVGSHEGPFAILNYTGNVIARLALGVMAPKEAAKELGVSVVELASSLTPWGSVNVDNEEGGIRGAAKALLVSSAFSIAQPLAEIKTNMDYAGRTVFTEKGQGDKNTPYYTRARKNTPQWAKDAAETLNNSTGGSEARVGWIDIPAEAVQKLVESFGKNAAKDVITAIETGKAIINGTTDDLESRMVPVKRDFVRDAPDSTSRYFNAKRDFEADYDEIKKLRMSREERANYIKERPWLRNAEVITKIISRIDDLRKLENGKVKNGRSWVPRNGEPSKENIEKWKAERLKLQARVLEFMNRNS